MTNDRILLLIVVAGVTLCFHSFTQLNWRTPRDDVNCICKCETQCSYSNSKTEDRIGVEKKMAIEKPAMFEPNKKNDAKLIFNKPALNMLEQKRRLDVLNKTCAKLHNQHKGTLSESQVKAHYLYDKKSKILFCDLPKIGSTFLKQVLHIVVGHRKESDPFKITGDEAHAIPFSSFSSLEFSDILPILQDSFKFLFVRNPYSRILSGYVDKIFTNNYVFWGGTGRRIVKEHRDKPANISLNCGHDVRFEEFIKYVIDSEVKNIHRNPHWYPVYDSCRPCSMRYDFIGKIENYHDDMIQLLTALNKEDTVDITTMDNKNDWEAIYLTVNRVYEVIKKKPHCVTLPQALERAWRVLQMRSVISFRADFPYAYIKNHANITKTNFIALIKENIEKNPLDKTVKKKIREEILFKAYSSLSKKTLDTFKGLFLPDFLYFGYNKETPSSVLGEITENWDPFTLKL